MKLLLVAGIVLLVLGIVSFFVPVPHSEHHGVSFGDARVGITTHEDEKVSPETAALVGFCLAMFNFNEFIYVD